MYSPEKDEQRNNPGGKRESVPLYKERHDLISDEGENAPDKIFMEKEEEEIARKEMEEKMGGKELTDEEILAFQRTRDEVAPLNDPKPYDTVSKGGMRVTTQDFIQMNRGINDRIEKLENDLQNPEITGALRKEKALLVASLRTQLNPHGKRDQQPEENQSDRIAA